MISGLGKSLVALRAHRDQIEALIKHTEEAIALHSHIREEAILPPAKKNYRTARERIEEAAYLMCSSQKYVKSYQIVAALEASGFVFAAARKDTAVSIVLHRSGNFVASHKYGWSLSQS